MTLSPPKIAIVGSGAIGCCYGAMLARSGLDVHFLMRSDYDTVCERGLEVRLPKETFVINPVQAHRETGTIGHCDLVIIALKATANSVINDLITPLVGEKTVILTLQNGLGNIENLSRAYDPSRLVGGLCFVCINRVAPGIVENYLPGRIRIAEAVGPAQERTHKIATWFKNAGINCEANDSLGLILWKKLCWNIPFNGLSIAGGGITTDRILQSPTLRSRARRLMEEIQAAAKALGYVIPDSHLDDQFTVTEKMEAYKPSSLIDYLAQKPVEVEAIFGEPLRQGEATGTAMPALFQLYNELRRLCQSEERPQNND